MNIHLHAQNQSTLKGPSPLNEPLYYLHNFRWMLGWVVRRHSALLSADEHAFANEFLTLPTASQGLFVRMVMRKGELFRADKLHYAELGESTFAAAALVERGWVDPEPQIDTATLFRLFTWPELRLMLADILASLGPRFVRKADALCALLPLQLQAKTLADWCKGGAYSNITAIYRLTKMPMCERLRIMFFGNGHQDWSEFVLAELGLSQYEPVEFTEQSRPFNSRAEVDAYMHLHVCRERLHEAQDPGHELLEEIISLLPALPSANPWLVRSRDRLLFSVARHWERAVQLERAEQLYRQCSWLGARGRLVRVLELQKRVEAALHLAEVAFAHPESEAELQSLLRVLPRLRRKAGLPALASANKPENTQTRSNGDDLHLTLPYQQPVEQAVKQYLAGENTEVYYVENGLLTSLFGLLCWDAIFAPLPGAFFHPFQRGPADLHWPDFHQRRTREFSAALNLLSSGGYQSAILHTFAEKQGRQSPFVNWNLITRELLEHALVCIPAAHLQLIFSRFLRDIKAHRSGLPDLIQFWPAEGRYRLLEVKAPGDKLQDNQKLWLDFFAAHQLPAFVCHVRWQMGGA